MRPWIATVTAYALALHVLLIGVAVGHAMPGGDASATSLFVICHGDGSSDPQDLPDNQPLVQSPCIFCKWQKRRVRSCRLAMALRSAVRWGFRTPRCKATDASSRFIR